LLRAIQGLVTGTVSAANALVAASAPRERSGYAMGLLQVGLWGGVSVGPLIGGTLADAVGFRASFILTAALLLIAGIMVALGVRESVPAAFQPNDVRPKLLMEWRKMLALPGVALTYFVRFLSQFARTLIVPIAPLFIQQLMPESARVNTMTGLVVGLSSAASTVSAIYLGRLGDRVGHRRVLMASALAGALLYLPQSLVTAAWQLLLLQVLTGAAAGGVIPALSALLAGYTRPGEEGSAYGIDNAVAAAARAVAPLLAVSLALWFGLRGTFIATAAIFLIMAVVALRWLPMPTFAKASKSVQSGA
jgi:DHA1 family multidrug resistance protein-like MFS transporter